MEQNTTPRKQILIKKASGEEELFSTQKLTQSLLNAGAKMETVTKIVTDIENFIYPDISTKKIYARAFALLHHEETASSMRYRLKQAIFDLGPTGYPFEALVGEIFKHEGYKTEVGVTVAGVCVTHEMDVIATSNKVQHLVECKFHKDQGKQVSVQVPLYVNSRTADIAEFRAKKAEFHGLKFEAWVYTNTRFSEDSTKYGLCKGMHLVAWDFPEGNGLKEQLERYKIFPITLLTSLTIREKEFLLGQGVVTCAQLHPRLDLLRDFEFTGAKLRALERELESVL